MKLRDLILGSALILIWLNMFLFALWADPDAANWKRLFAISSACLMIANAQIMMMKGRQ